MNRYIVNVRTPVFVSLAALIGACSRAPATPPDAATAPAARAVAPRESLRISADRARVQGDSTAPLWIVVASDFQCPYCAQWHRDTYAALRDEYVRTGKARMAYLNFPLDQHQHAREAAAAAMCAGAQGKFWGAHDAIFDSQLRWAATASATAQFDSLLAAAGVAMQPWRQCMRDSVMNTIVLADRDRAARAGVQSTPTFLISYARPPARQGHLISGAAPLAEFKRVLDSMLAPGSGD